jgi:hypothetical protein
MVKSVNSLTQFTVFGRLVREPTGFLNKSNLKGYQENIMALLAFWFKVILRRIIGLVKISPVVTIGGIIILSAFIYTNTTQVTLDFNKLIITCFFLTLIPVILSVHEYTILGEMTFYAKSNYSNRLLRYIFYIKKSLLNNMLMVVFLALVFSKRILFDFPFNTLKTLPIFPFSVFLSFAVIVLRNNGKKTIHKRRGKIHINPLIKSTVYDYFNSLLMAVIITALSPVIGIALFKDTHALREMAEPVFIPLILFALLSMGFAGLSDSIININWMFYSIVSLDLRHQFKRTLLFTVSSYGIVLLHYIIAVAYVDMTALLIYLFGIGLMMLLSIGIAYSKGSILKKIIIYGILIRLTLYAMYVNPYLMLAGILPLIIVFFIAKNDFIEWGYL